MELKPHDLQEHSLSFWFIPLLLLILLSAIAVAGQSDGIDGIIITEEDFQALVAIKRALQDPRNALKSWNESSSGACSGSWEGIKCAQGQVIALQLPGKGLGGRLAEEIGQLIALRKINLHTNFIRGQIPPSLAMLRNLRGLYLFQNRLSGSLPPGLASSPVLQALDLSRNQLSGAIPRDFATSPRLFRLDLSYNNLVAGIPPSLASLKGLKDLRLRNNQLQGSIPSQLGHFSGLLTLDLSYNHLNGSIPTAFVNLSSLISLSLAHNNLTGSLLKQLNRLQKLQELNVSSNNLSGTIPPELGKMTGLAAIDLSRNNFNGRLPLSLNGLTNLSSFDCSYNNLSGPVPALLRSFGESSFTGNVGVCGLKTDTPCSPASPLPIEGLNTTMKGGVGKRRRFNTVSVIFVVVGSVAAGIFLLSLLAGILWQCGCMYILLICCRKRPFAGRKKGATDEKKAGQISSPKEARDVGGGKLVHFDGSLNFSADDMLCATAEVLGKSTYGTVYKAMLEDGNQVAVKRLREGIVKSQRDFETEVIALGAIRHPNLVALRAYYWGAKGEKLLVYDYMPGGSLAAFLHARGPETPLAWQTRINIAVGAARGLAYLHNHEKMIHGHLTSSNILLDSQMGAKLSDFGLSRLMTTTANSSAIATASALGYRAPELTKLRKATTKSDVYSFGIVLLELLTGKAPGEAASTETGMDLPEWVASKVKEEWTNEIFDLELMKGVAPAEEELISTLQLAMNCVVLSSSSRPEMDEVAHQLEEMKPEVRQPSSSAAV